MVGFSRMRRHWLVAFVLPLLALRAMIPAGFMATPVGGALQLTFCGVGSLHHHDHGHSTSHAADSSCPFAQSAGPAPLPSLPVLPPSVAATVVAAATDSGQTNLHFGPPRQHAPRGPPALA